MAKMTPNQIADRWAQGMAGAGPKITAGVQAVSQSPMAKAAAAKDRYVAGVNEAAASGKWERGLARVSLEDWKQSLLGKGITRIAAGAQGAKSKVQEFMNVWIPYVDSVVSRLPERGGLEENIARMNAMVRAAAAFKRPN